MIKAIQTSYKGYRFRSRLEARWAVFFDHLKLQWEYEPEGFHLLNGDMYLPDFRIWTPQKNAIWYEVKPTHAADDKKLKLFSELLQRDSEQNNGKVFRTALLVGDPIDHLWKKIPYENGVFGTICVCPRCGFINDPEYGFDYDKNYDQFWIGCQSCDFETPGGGGHPYENGVLGCLCTPHKGHVIGWTEDYSRLILQINNAAIAARSARFEHGERHAS
jgi:hypothetical protein